MNKCYDFLSKDYQCAEEKINCIFAEDVNRHYKQKRYGIKSCKKDLDEQKLWDLQQLFMYDLQMDLSCFDLNTYRNELYINNDLLTENTNHFTQDFKLQAIKVCNISNLIEKINSL